MQGMSSTALLGTYRIENSMSVRNEPYADALSRSILT
jgi:hypothetical protein